MRKKRTGWAGIEPATPNPIWVPPGNGYREVFEEMATCDGAAEGFTDEPAVSRPSRSQHPPPMPRHDLPAAPQAMPSREPVWPPSNRRAPWATEPRCRRQYLRRWN